MKTVDSLLLALLNAGQRTARAIPALGKFTTTGLLVGG
ncbi:MAG: hypothetical protein M2R45_04425 [Verrucomicrobia subdivision 3 bacterium]|nr:hypothetical protein [Limisphaerales bacterium]MCS1413513.1 hypothetical protein [Limisphaerales bacterium]